MAIPTELKHDIPEPGRDISADTSRHPLDPLYAEELDQVVGILKREKYLGDSVRVASLNLVEPPKHLIEKQQAESERKALAVLIDRGKRTSYEAMVDLIADSVISMKELPPGVQPSMMLDEFAECEDAVRR
jgi:primary-amine oxidase